MSGYFKLMLSCILMLAPRFAAGQDSLDLTGFQASDSLQDKRIERLEYELRSMERSYRQLKSESGARIDSLDSRLREQQIRIRQLEAADQQIRQEVSVVKAELSRNRGFMAENRQYFNRILLISVPSLLLIILFASFLFYFLINRYQKKTDARIRTLRKYTHEGIEEIRTDYMQEIKQRLKKLSSRLKKREKKTIKQLKGKSSSKKGKKKKRKKE